jgi:hypothetical protein
MAGLDVKQFVVIHVEKVAEEADFISRIFNAAAIVVSDKVRMVDTGRFTLRIEKANSPAEVTRNVQLEVHANNVNRFAEEVWNRGVKYASRPQNHADGLRRVAFVSPGDIRITGVGPLKLDSTGAFPAFRPDGTPEPK